jgi:methyl-accepting chemotaxis protein
VYSSTRYRSAREYRAFWEKLGRGEYDAGQYKRIAKGARELWLQASYNPIFDLNGKPYKVVKYATDVTAQVHGASAAPPSSATWRRSA